jgi:ribonuclease-3
MNENHLSSMLNYEFRNVSLLSQALTRQSAITEGILGASEKTYQRLEFLGDSLLRLIVSEMIFSILPEASECDMTNLRMSFEKNEFIGRLALMIGIGKFIKIGKGEEKQNLRENVRLLADIFEAIVAAIYIDSDYITTKRVILNIYKEYLWGEKKMIENERKVEAFYQSMNSSHYPLRSINSTSQPNLEIAPGPAVSLSPEIKSDFSSRLISALNRNTESSLGEFILRESRNVLIDYELLKFFGNHSNYFSLNIKNYLDLFLLKSRKYYYELKLKPHYICCKILLYLLIMYKHSDNYISFITISCLSHNGISEYFRQNLDKAKSYFEQAFSILKEHSLCLPEIKLLTTYYYCELEEDDVNFKDYLSLLENDKTVISLTNSEENEVSIHTKTILLSMKLKSKVKELKAKDPAQLKFLFNETLAILHTDLHRSKVLTSLNFFKVYFEMVKLGFHEVNLKEIQDLEQSVRKSFGDFSIHLLFFYKFYVNHGLNSQIHNSEYVNLLIENYTLSASILMREFENFSNLVNIEN